MLIGNNRAKCLTLVTRLRLYNHNSSRVPRSATATPAAILSPRRTSDAAHTLDAVGRLPASRGSRHQRYRLDLLLRYSLRRWFPCTFLYDWFLCTFHPYAGTATGTMRRM